MRLTFETLIYDLLHDYDIKYKIYRREDKFCKVVIQYNFDPLHIHHLSLIEFEGIKHFYIETCKSLNLIITHFEFNYCSDKNKIIFFEVLIN
jgi:hypothetical protein